MITVRDAVEADVPVIARLIRELAQYERLADAVRMTEDGLRDHLFGERRHAEVLIAQTEAGQPVGFALFFHNFSTFEGRPGIYLEDLYVTPEARGTGAGRALMKRLAQAAEQRGCARLEWSVLDWNETALDFYRRLGAHPNEGWTTYRLSGDALAALAKGEGA
jgi:GNAT superfamily N-acetyltransferase